VVVLWLHARVQEDPRGEGPCSSQAASAQASPVGRQDDHPEREAEMILTAGSMPSIERCRYCKGTGWLGRLMCETCAGFGIIETGRGCVLPLIYDLDQE